MQAEACPKIAYEAVQFTTCWVIIAHVVNTHLCNVRAKLWIISCFGLLVCQLRITGVQNTTVIAHSSEADGANVHWHSLQ